MTEHDDRLYLDHIVEAAERIARSTGNRRSRFFEDVDVQDATLRRLQTIAESSQRLSSELRARHPEIPWRDVAAFRNRLVHDYLGVDLERAWAVVERDLPPLVQLARREIDVRRGLDRDRSKESPGLDLGR